MKNKQTVANVDKSIEEQKNIGSRINKIYPVFREPGQSEEDFVNEIKSRGGTTDYIPSDIREGMTYPVYVPDDNQAVELAKEFEPGALNEFREATKEIYDAEPEMNFATDEENIQQDFENELRRRMSATKPEDKTENWVSRQTTLKEGQSFAGNLQNEHGLEPGQAAIIGNELSEAAGYESTNVPPGTTVVFYENTETGEITPEVPGGIELGEEDLTPAIGLKEPETKEVSTGHGAVTLQNMVNIYNETKPDGEKSMSDVVADRIWRPDSIASPSDDPNFFDRGIQGLFLQSLQNAGEHVRDLFTKPVDEVKIDKETMKTVGKEAMKFMAAVFNPQFTMQMMQMGQQKHQFQQKLEQQKHQFQQKFTMKLMEMGQQKHQFQQQLALRERKQQIDAMNNDLSMRKSFIDEYRNRLSKSSNISSAHGEDEAKKRMLAARTIGDLSGLNSKQIKEKYGGYLNRLATAPPEEVDDELDFKLFNSFLDNITSILSNPGDPANKMMAANNVGLHFMGRLEDEGLRQAVTNFLDSQPDNSLLRLIDKTFNQSDSESAKQLLEIEKKNKGTLQSNLEIARKYVDLKDTEDFIGYLQGIASPEIDIDESLFQGIDDRDVDNAFKDAQLGAVSKVLMENFHADIGPLHRLANTLFGQDPAEMVATLSQLPNEFKGGEEETAINEITRALHNVTKLDVNRSVVSQYINMAHDRETSNVDITQTVKDVYQTFITSGVRNQLRSLTGKGTEASPAPPVADDFIFQAKTQQFINRNPEKNVRVALKEYAEQMIDAKNIDVSRRRNTVYGEAAIEQVVAHYFRDPSILENLSDTDYTKIYSGFHNAFRTGETDVLQRTIDDISLQ